MWGLLAMTMATTPFAGATWLTVPPATNGIEGASWIWIASATYPEPGRQAAPGTARFRKGWQIDRLPTRATITFTADNACRVLINGRQVGESNNWSQLTTVDVTAALRPGNNTVEISGTNGQATGNDNPAGVLFALRSDTTSLATDATWTSPDGEVVRIGDHTVAPWRIRPPEGPAPVFRRQFHLRHKPRRAVARIIGLGHFDLYVNGVRQGNGLFNQPWSQYDKRLYYTTFEIEDDLREGENTIVVMMGGSFYRVGTPPAGRYTKADAMPDFSQGEPYLLVGEFELHDGFGRAEVLTTDPGWKWREGPYRLSHIYAGEDYDARAWDDAWFRPSESDTGWHPAIATNPRPVAITPIDWPEIRAFDTWAPKRVIPREPGRTSFDFGQNAAGTIRLRVRGRSGDTVLMTPSEVMTADGDVQQLNLWGGAATCSYTLRGGETEEHEWRFFYHGFQCLEVKGAVVAGAPNPDGLPVIESIEMLPVRTMNRQSGDFVSSSEVFNHAHHLVDWAVQSNMSYVLTDCPHREKAGWLECAHLLFGSIAYRYDVQAWMHKICRDMRDAQLPNGQVLTVAPRVLMLPPENAFAFTVEWGAASVLVPWQAYEWYGDRRFLDENYEMMKGYVDYLASRSPDGVAPAGLGDWYDYGHGQPPGPSRYTPTDLTATAMYAMCLAAVAEAAEVLGRQAEAVGYRALRATVQAAFLEKFYDPATATFRNNGSVQTGSAMALCADLVPDGDRERVLSNIVTELEERGYQQTPGDVGHLYLIRALAQAGRSDVLHKVYARTSTGSYGGIWLKGLTAMPETWDAITVGSNSLNHCMLGHVMEWFYGYVLGVRQADGSVGWREVLIAPEPGETRSAEGKVGTPRGAVSVSWETDGNEFRLRATVPSGMSCRFVPPAGFGDALELRTGENEVVRRRG